MVKRLLFLCWLVLQVLFMGGCSYTLLMLTVFWLVGFWQWLHHELRLTGLEFLGLSAFFWFIVLGYVVAVRTWWPYARQTLRAIRKPAAASPHPTGQ
jgi:hypothetical protein